MQIRFEGDKLECYAMHGTNSIKPILEYAYGVSDFWLVHGRSKVDRGMQDKGRYSEDHRTRADKDISTDFRSSAVTPASSLANFGPF